MTVVYCLVLLSYPTFKGCNHCPNRSGNVVAHLACHASQDSHDHLRSGFCLRDGRLEVFSILKNENPGAD